MNSLYGLPAECLTCHLRSSDSFCALSKASLEAFSRIKHSAIFPGGAVVFAEGQIPNVVFLLCQGQVKVSTSSRDGKTFILRIVTPGVVLGLDSAVSGKPYEFTAETMQPCQVNFVDREDFLRFIREHGDACLQAARQIGRDCQHAYEVVRSIGLSHSISGRVAKFLLASATDGRVTKGVVHTSLALTHEEIAQLVGTSRETISRTLSALRKKDIIELRGSTLIIHDKSALEHLATA